MTATDITTKAEQLHWYELPLYLFVGLALGFVGVLGINVLFPAMASSAAGAEPKAYWYVSRAAAFVAYGLLWVSMALGLLQSRRASKAWPGPEAAIDLHEFTTLTALAFSAMHVLVLLGDSYIKYNLGSLLLPFGNDYRPAWVLLGQVGAYLVVPVVGSFYLRRHLGPKTWRTLHYLTFAVFTLVTAHGLGAGTDANNPAVLTMYGLAIVSLYAMTVYRILATIKTNKTAKVQPARA